MRPTTEELAFAADIRARDATIAAECVARGFTSKRNGWTSYPNGTKFSVVAPTNAERSRAELIEFRLGATCVKPGESYLAYLSESKPHEMPLCNGLHVTRRITTFMGDTLAFVTRYSSRKVPGGYLTNTRGSFWARGIDGRIYHGRHNGAGMYCRMRLAKHQ